MKKINKNDLIDFENKIIKLFNNAKIKSPVHLHSGNEENLIKIFKKIKKMIGCLVRGDLIITAY